MKYGVKLAGSFALWIAVACGTEGRTAFDAGDGVPPGSNTGGSGNPLDPGEQIPEPEGPETEVDRSFRVPVVTGRWVWTANPLSGRVALIDATTFTVKTALAGAGPTYLAALPSSQGSARALVMNVESHDATLLATTEDGEIAALTTLPVHVGANAWAVSHDGRFAIAWTDASVEAKPDPSQGFQDITVLDLRGEEPSARRLSVGYRPARVFMDDDGRYAYIVTDAGIDVVDLEAEGGALVEREVELSANPASDTARRDVSVTPNGEYAFVRRDGKDYVTVVSLEQAAFKDISLPGVVTDLDLSADAAMAIAIVREPTLAADGSAAGVGMGGEAGQTNEVAGGAGAGGEASGGDGPEAGGAGGAVGGAGPGTQQPFTSMAVLLPVASIFASPDLYEQVQLDELFGSVELGEAGETALLYSNAAPSTHLTLLRLAADEAFAHRTLDLKLPVFSAISAPDGAHAIALLKPRAGSALPGAFAVVPVTKDLPAKIQGTRALTVPSDLATETPAMVAVSDARALVTVTDGATTHVAYLARMPELTVDAFELASRPLPQASGIVPEANQAFIAQQHPEGRITFIDLDSNEVHTLTGFELSTQVSQ